ncbi:MAG: hypothetical protein MJK18_00750 [Bdellovibrionales bacterium]|nr:hypothetical protein [Bdellovibrionales bacterium]
MKSLLLLTAIVFLTLPSFAGSKKNTIIRNLNQICMQQGSFDRMKPLCDCIKEKVHEPMALRHLNHLRYVYNGQRNQTRLSDQEGTEVESFEAAAIETFCLSTN